MALDHPLAVKKLAVLDIAPTRLMYAASDQTFATAYFHWYFLIQPAPFPETLIGADPDFFIKFQMGRRHGGLSVFDPEAMNEYLRCFRDPAAIHASCEDYRAAAGIDLEHDAADAEKKVECPLLVLWGRHGVIEHCFDALAEWNKVARDVRGQALECGHYLAEEKTRRGAGPGGTFPARLTRRFRTARWRSACGAQSPILRQSGSPRPRPCCRDA